MSQDFVRPEVLFDRHQRPLLLAWLRGDFRQILVQSRSPLFTLQEVFYHYPEELLELEGVPDLRQLAPLLMVAGFHKVRRVRIDATLRRVIWTAAHEAEYRTWPPQRLGRAALEQHPKRRTPRKDSILEGRIEELVGPWSML